MIVVSVVLPAPFRGVFRAVRGGRRRASLEVRRILQRRVKAGIKSRMREAVSPASVAVGGALLRRAARRFALAFLDFFDRRPFLPFLPIAGGVLARGLVRRW